MEVKAYKNKIGIKNKILRTLWHIIYIVLFYPFSGPLFYHWRVLLLRMFGAKIGKHCKIRSSVKVWAPWNIVLGDYVALGPGVELYSVDKIVIGTKVAISQKTYICTASHDITQKGNPLITAPIYIHNFAWVAADAFVGMGISIGEGAVVGARAAVFKDVEPWTVVGGNPAKFIKKRVLKD